MKGRYFLEIAYIGSAYHGWQVQHNALSVQEMLESCIFRILGEKPDTIASGRTDTGVHALQQFAHVDLPLELDKADFLYKLNSVLPQDMAIKNIFKVNDDANARYSAVSRSYLYKIHRKKDPFANGFSYYYPFALDVNKMNQVCVDLIGEKDFQCFSKVKTGVTHFTCRITEAMWTERDDQYFFSISANRFLRGMVRAVVGSMLEVGRGNMMVEDFEKILESRDRREAGRSVPACGLYLTKVEYPNEIFMVN